MAKLFGVHEIELLPGVNEADFERFVIEEFIPNVPFEGWTQRLAKADRGERQGKYAIIIKLDTADGDRYVPEDNQLSAEGERHAASLSDLMTKFATFSSTTPGMNTVHSDYVIVDG